MAFGKHAADVDVLEKRCTAAEAAFAARSWAYAWPSGKLARRDPNFATCSKRMSPKSAATALVPAERRRVVARRYDEAAADRAAQTAKAEEAGRRGKILNTQIGMLIDEAARAAARPYAELEIYRQVATTALAEKDLLERRTRLISPTLGAMLRAPDGAVAALGAVLAVALGVVPSRAAALEQLETAAMGREELLQRTIWALACPTPVVSEKKKAAKGKGGKKGGKKGAGKKKGGAKKKAAKGDAKPKKGKAKAKKGKKKK